MKKEIRQQCYASLLTYPVRTLDELATAIQEKGSASAFIHEQERVELRVLLVTDLVQSTATLHRLGDERGREYIAQHDALIRGCLRSHQGVEIAHTGDGVIASFASASQAVHCACAIQRAVTRYNREAPIAPMHVRIGGHVGRPLMQDGRLLGACVNAAVRVCAKADGGQVLASRQLCELLQPQSFRVVARGPMQLRGVPDPVDIYEIDWTTEAPILLN